MCKRTVYYTVAIVCDGAAISMIILLWTIRTFHRWRQEKRFPSSETRKPVWDVGRKSRRIRMDFPYFPDSWPNASMFRLSIVIRTISYQNSDLDGDFSACRAVETKNGRYITSVLLASKFKLSAYTRRDNILWQAVASIGLNFESFRIKINLMNTAI